MQSTTKPTAGTDAGSSAGKITIKNRKLNTVTGAVTLAAPASLTAGADQAQVLFVVQGPSAFAVIDDTAPYEIPLDPAAQKLSNGRYVVSATLLGVKAKRVAGTLAIRAKAGATPTASPSASASPTDTATPTTTDAPAPTSEPSSPTSEPSSTDTETKTTEPSSSETKTSEPSTSTTTAAPTTSTAAPTTSTSAPTTSAGSALSAEAAEVVRLTNAERAKNGCQALTVNAALTRSAQGHSDDMSANNYFAHNSQDGRTPFDRMKAAGYTYSMAAENIAAGQRTASDVVAAWMGSPGHRANIVNCGLKEIGVGVAKGGSYGIYWTQNFGTPR